jgi:hypothetical protein
MLRKVALFGCVVALAGVAYCQTSVGELDAAMAGQAQLDSASAGGGLNSANYTQRARDAAQTANAMPGLPPTGTVPNPGTGYAPPPAVGFPGIQQTPPSGFPGLSQPGVNTNPYGVAAPPYGQGPVVATPTPIPTIKVLVGKRVYCAVCGHLLEDAIQLTVPQSDQEKYLDDGVHDNGIANDGIRGSVEIVKDQYVGTECNAVKNRLVNVVRRAEELYQPQVMRNSETPLFLFEDAGDRQKRLDIQANRLVDEASTMLFFGYHVMSVNPVTDNPALPNLLEKQQQRDEMLRDWNNKFLADYRTDKNDPQSSFFQLYVPEPPQIPQYPLPAGYMAPQKLLEGAPGQGGVPGIQPTPNIYNGDAVVPFV